MNLASRKTNIALGALLLVGITGYSIGANAHGGATGIVKQRMDLMSNIGKAQKTLTEMFNGKNAYNIDSVRAAATTIESHAGERIFKLFPKGSAKKPSEALPAIWSDWSQFKSLSDDLGVFARALHDNAGNKTTGMMSGKTNGMMGSGTMMGGGNMMGCKTMMGGSALNVKEQVEMLGQMPPMASFQRVAQTCTACHTKFRMKKK